MPDGQRRQRQYHDFFNYAGLNRGVWLYSTARSHIVDVTVITDIEDGVGIVGYSTDIDEPGATTVNVELLDAEGATVAAATGGEGELQVGPPHLWQPGNGLSLRAPGRPDGRRGR